MSVAYQHVRETPVPPSELDPVITPEMDAITLKALAKDRTQRYQTAKEMRDDIGRLLDGDQVQAVAPVPVPDSAGPTQVVPATVLALPSPLTATTPVVAVTDAPRRAVTYQERPRPRTAAAVVVTLALALVAGLLGGLWWLNRAPTPRAVTVSVPQVLSMTVENATQTLESAGLKPDVKSVEGPDDATVNTVIRQDPVKGVDVAKGSSVAITVNIGPAKGQIPAGLLGQDKDAVIRALTALGFTKITAVEAVNEPVTAQANKVITLNPVEGATIAKTTAITVTYATGKSKVPNLVGYSRDTAIKAAQDAGFTKYKIVEQESTQAVGTVLATTPAADTLVDRTTELSIVVARTLVTPPPTVTVTAPPPSTPAATPSTSASSSR